MESRTTQLLVIGGGPAGATVATLAAKAGVEVIVLEADVHPRAHVGESLLPGMIPILEAMDALAEVEAAGFGHKTGSTHFGWGSTPEWDLWFADTDLYEHAWLVDRARFDAILVDAARRAGARVWEHCAAKELLWEEGRLVGVRYRRRGDEGVVSGTVHAQLVVDATGQAALLARTFELREHLPGLRHQAAWAHFEGVVGLPPPRHQQAVFVAEPGHWIWFFPLGGGRGSVGLITLDGRDDERVGSSTEGERGGGAPDYEATIRASPKIAEVLGPAARLATPVRRQRDWSYRVREITGEGWMIAGDASGFIDPVLSTGVFLAMNAGYLAAKAVSSVILQGADEGAALAGYARAHRELFDDLLRMVRFYYQQTLSLDDYFWESKRIMMTEATELRPQKAFMILTSGLIKNLALDDLQSEQGTRQSGVVAEGGDETSAPEGELGFVCVELRFVPGEAEACRAGTLYFLIEPRRRAEPALARSRNWQFTCVAPRHDNNPYAVPALRGPIEGLIADLRALDDRPGEGLGDFWRRRRGAFRGLLAALPSSFAVARVFGE